MPTRNKGKRLRISPRVSLRKSVVTDPRASMDIGRNDLCPCGSGEKYKNCCITKGDIFLRRLAKKQAKVENKIKRKQDWQDRGGLLGFVKSLRKK